MRYLRFLQNDDATVNDVWNAMVSDSPDKPPSLGAEKPDDVSSPGTRESSTRGGRSRLGLQDAACYAIVLSNKREVPSGTLLVAGSEISILDREDNGGMGRYNGICRREDTAPYRLGLLPVLHRSYKTLTRVEDHIRG